QIRTIPARMIDFIPVANGICLISQHRVKRVLPTARCLPPAQDRTGPGGSDRVPGGFGGVGASRWGGPSEGPVGELVDCPLGVLLEAVVVTAFRAGVAAAGPAAGFVGGVVLDVALGGGPPAYRAGAGGVPDLDQVPEPGPGVVALGLVPVVAGVGGQRFYGDDQAGPVAGGAQPPGAVPDGVAARVGHGDAPGRLRIPRRGGAGEVAGQPRVNGPDPAGPVREAGDGGQRDGQGHPPGEPARYRAA